MCFTNFSQRQRISFSRRRQKDGKTMKRFGIILFGLAVVFGQPLAAQTIASDPPNQGEVQYLYNNPGEFSKATFGGAYVGPYAGTLLKIGADPTNAAMSLYCVDFLNWTIPGQVVTADVSNIGAGNTSLARAGQLGLQSYMKAAFLSSLFQSYPSISQFTGFSQYQAWSGIHGAIWYFMHGEGRYSTCTNPALGSFMDYATANYGDWGGYNQWSVLTTTAVSGNPLWDSQEFLVQTRGLRPLTAEPPSVPEPQTYLLMGARLLKLSTYPSVDPLQLR